MRWGGGFNDFARMVLEDGVAREEIERALHFAWYIVRVEGHAEFSAHDLVELFQRAHISRPNTSRLGSNLAKSRWTFKGTAVGSFRLTATALAELDELYGGGLLEEEPPSPSVAFADDLEAKQSALTSNAVRAFVGEAIGCLRSGHHRAAVVLSWIGAIAVIQEHIVRNNLPAFNTDAKANGLLKRDAMNIADLSRLKESDFLDVLERISVLSNAVKKELKICLDRRNNCGHPNDYVATDPTVAAHISSLLVHVFQRF